MERIPHAVRALQQPPIIPSCYNSDVKLRELHSWNVSTGEAVQLQQRLAPLVSHTSTLREEVRYVAGLDISAPRRSGLARGAAVVLRYPSLQVEEVRTAEARPLLPYVPGLLSFREVPVLVGAVELLSVTPDLVLVDGQGIAHPRRFGLACHLGLMLDLPTIGCAKSILVGRHAGPLPREAGSRVELVDKGEVVGVALRTRTDVNPVYVSVGHRIDLQTAVEWALACCRGLRIPEPTRLAHQAAGGHLAPRGPATVPGGPTAPEQRRMF
jgi:deoxyribonuclease V